MLTKTSGIVARDAPVSYWLILLLVLSLAEVLAKVNSVVSKEVNKSCQALE